jgi:7-dehydrocholesterol reductase
MYLSVRPKQYDWTYCIIIIVVGLVSLYINYISDYQRLITRRMKGNNKIWGRKPNVIKAQYQTSDGKTRENLLLVDGFWKISRHFNYLPELLLAFCWSLPVGFDTFLPWNYFFQLCGLLTDRTLRDDTRCQLKYGKYWDEYCKQVPYKMIPYVF